MRIDELNLHNSANAYVAEATKVTSSAHAVHFRKRFATFRDLGRSSVLVPGDENLEGTRSDFWGRSAYGSAWVETPAGGEMTYFFFVAT
ncbi:MAG: hypothetical protein C4318_02665 [Acidimicrobiia bacterium]